MAKAKSKKFGDIELLQYTAADLRLAKLGGFKRKKPKQTTPSGKSKSLRTKANQNNAFVRAMLPYIEKGKAQEGINGTKDNLSEALKNNGK